MNIYLTSSNFYLDGG